jgi:hypothetical protein
MLRKRPSDGRNLQLLPNPPMLMGESLDDFLALKSALEEVIRPQDMLEQILIAHYAEDTWECLRLRRFKVEIINCRQRPALKNLLYDNLQLVGEKKAEALSLAFFTDQNARKEVLQFFGQLNLGEGAIEAEAIRQLLNELEQADKLLAFAEGSRRRALQQIREHREGLASIVERAANRVLGQPSRLLPSVMKAETDNG